MSLKPQSFLYLRSGYTLETFRKDLLAGVTVGIIALPLAMAFAIASGVPPERGIFTTIVAGFLISALGGSRFQIGGPTGAFVAIIYGVVQRSGYEGLAIATFIAAFLLMAMALFRLGSWIKYIPHPLVTGLTTGIALIIFSAQMRDFFGLKMGSPPADFIEKWIAYGKAFPTLNPTALGLGVATLALILFIRRFVPKIPWGIGSVVIATLAVKVLNIPVETIFSRFGEIPRSLPFPALPSLNISWEQFPNLFNDAIAIAFLGAIESLLSCVIADGMMGTRHNSNSELLGQGVANFFSVLFGGIPATGALARTAANVKTGGQTPMAGMLHAVTVFLIVLMAAPLVSEVPLPALAAVLIMVAWNMSEMGHFIQTLKGPIGDMSILMVAFLMTVFIDITYAIMFGMILASFLFMKKMSDSSKMVSLTQLFREPTSEQSEREDPDSIAKRVVPEGVEVYEIQGPFFFGAADQLKDMMHEMSISPKVFILRMRHVPFIDASGAHALSEFCHKCKREGTTLLFSGVQGQLKKDLKRFGIESLVGEPHLFSHIDPALEKARSLISGK